MGMLHVSTGTNESISCQHRIPCGSCLSTSAAQNSLKVKFFFVCEFQHGDRTFLRNLYRSVFVDEYSVPRKNAKLLRVHTGFGMRSGSMLRYRHEPLQHPVLSFLRPIRRLLPRRCGAPEHDAAFPQ